jgi:hypothetical protein
MANCASNLILLMSSYIYKASRIITSVDFFKKTKSQNYLGSVTAITTYSIFHRTIFSINLVSYFSHDVMSINMFYIYIHMIKYVKCIHISIVLMNVFSVHSLPMLWPMFIPHTCVGTLWRSSFLLMSVNTGFSSAMFPCPHTFLFSHVI